MVDSIRCSFQNEKRRERKFVGEFLREAKFWEYREVEGTIRVLTGIMKDKTMDDTLRYIPIKDKQNYSSLYQNYWLNPPITIQ